MKLLGLTGGVGMGKSTAAEFFQKRGIRIADTDQLARELVQPGQPALHEIRTVFGEKIIAPDGQLRRDELANVVFSDIAARKKLEEILHPRIRERWLARAETWRRENCHCAIVVIPLLYETRAVPHFDKVICVACSEQSRRERLQGRGWTQSQIESRIAAQMPITDKIARADFVIWSEGVRDNHSRQVDCILDRVRAIE